MLNEQSYKFGHQVNLVLTAVQHLEEDMHGMGLRQLAKLCEGIVNQLRRILHTQWPTRHMSHLKELQKVAVALMDAVEKKDDLREILPAIAQELQAVTSKIGGKVNDLQATEEEKA